MLTFIHGNTAWAGSDPGLELHTTLLDGVQTMDGNTASDACSH